MQGCTVRLHREAPSDHPDIIAKDIVTQAFILESGDCAAAACFCWCYGVF